MIDNDNLQYIADLSKPYLDVVQEAAEVIPLVKTVVASVKIPRTISDAIYAHKFNEFLFSSKLTHEDIERLDKKLNPKDNVKVWEKVVLSINNHDDKEKSKFIGKLMRALVNDSITKEEFFDMVHATNNINLQQIQKLNRLYVTGGKEGISANLFSSFGGLDLITIDNTSIGDMGSSGGPVYKHNQMGWMFIGILFDYPLAEYGDFKIGEDDLVEEIRPDHQSSGQYFPFREIIKRGTMYEAVDLYYVNDNLDVLCNRDNGLLSLAVSAPVRAGDYMNSTANRINPNNLGQSKIIRGYGMGQPKMTHWGGITLFDGVPKDNEEFISVSDLKKFIEDNAEGSEQREYAISIADEMKKLIDAGELEVSHIRN